MFLYASKSLSRCWPTQFLVRALFLSCKHQPSLCVLTWRPRGETDLSLFLLLWGHQFYRISTPLLQLYLILKRKVKVLVTQFCPTLWDPMGYSPPASSDHGILQARILGWVASPFSRGSSLPRDWTQVSCVYHLSHQENPYLTFSSVQSLGCVWLFATPWTAACQASLSITNSRSLPKLMSHNLNHSLKVLSLNIVTMSHIWGYPIQSLATYLPFEVGIRYKIDLEWNYRILLPQATKYSLLSLSCTYLFSFPE